MPTEIDNSDFPKRIPEKLKTIRERLGLTPDDIALKVGAKTGAEIVAYENDEDDLLLVVLWKYAKLCKLRQRPIDTFGVQAARLHTTAGGN